MSFAFEFADPPALRQFQLLDPWLAEETLDELEVLVSDASDSRKFRDIEFVHDFVRLQGGIRYYVFLTIRPNRAGQLITVANIGTFARPVWVHDWH